MEVVTSKDLKEPPLRKENKKDYSRFWLLIKGDFEPVNQEVISRIGNEQVEVKGNKNYNHLKDDLRQGRLSIIG